MSGRCFERAQALLDDAVVVVCAGALLVLGFGQAEEQQAAQAEARGLLGLADGFVDGEVEDAGHGADRAADALAGAEKEGIDQVAGVDGGLADQGAQGSVRRRRRIRVSGKLMETIVVDRCLRRSANCHAQIWSDVCS